MPVVIEFAWWMLEGSNAHHDIRTILATSAHEALHCFGLDHCITWECLMNSNHVEDKDECLFLSPLNLKKLVKTIKPKRFHDNNYVSRYVIDRYHALSKVLRELELESEADWANHKASLVEEAVSILPNKRAGQPIQRATKREKKV